MYGYSTTRPNWVGVYGAISPSTFNGCSIYLLGSSTFGITFITLSAKDGDSVKVTRLDTGASALIPFSGNTSDIAEYMNTSTALFTSSDLNKTIPLTIEVA